MLGAYTARDIRMIKFDDTGRPLSVLHGLLERIPVELPDPESRFTRSIVNAIECLSEDGGNGRFAQTAYVALHTLLCTTCGHEARNRNTLATALATMRAIPVLYSLSEYLTRTEWKECRTDGLPGFREHVQPV